MTLQEIKQAIENGTRVYWANKSYEVVRDRESHYMINFRNRSFIGLTWKDGETLNGKESEFFIE